MVGVRGVTRHTDYSAAAAVVAVPSAQKVTEGTAAAFEVTESHRKAAACYCWYCHRMHLEMLAVAAVGLSGAQASLKVMS